MGVICSKSSQLYCISKKSQLYQKIRIVLLFKRVILHITLSSHLVYIAMPSYKPLNQPLKKKLRTDWYLHISYIYLHKIFLKIKLNKSTSYVPKPELIYVWVILWDNIRQDNTIRFSFIWQNYFLFSYENIFHNSFLITLKYYFFTKYNFYIYPYFLTKSQHNPQLKTKRWKSREEI